MSSSDNAAAHLRGGFVGAASGSTSVVVHGLAGGAVPAGASVVLLVLACVTVGAMAGSLARGRVLPLALFLVAGQTLGHLMLMTASHHHAAGFSAAMLAAHGLAALGCGLLIAMAERCWRAVATALHRLTVLVAGYRLGTASASVAAMACRQPVPVPRPGLATSVTMRGPPRRAFS